MRVAEFKKELRKRIQLMPEAEIKKAIAFYVEVVLDKIESGIIEEVAIADLGDLDTIAGKILAEYSLNIERKPKMNKLLIIALLILASPLLIGLFATLFGVLVSVFAILFVILLLGYIILLGSIFMIIFAFVTYANMPMFLYDLGTGLASFGLGLLFIVLNQHVFHSIKRNWPSFKRRFMKLFGFGKKNQEIGGKYE